MPYEIGLVLEGGGMRGVFTSGLCDALLDYGVTFPYVIGTSAGASNGCCFVARQRGRNRFVNIDMHALRPYVGLRSVLRGQGVIDLDFIFNEVEQKFYPFDFETYSASPTRLVIVSTSALTGQAVYTEEKRDFRRFADACRSSCSLPILCPQWHVDGQPMVDGGVADSIPFNRALADGCRRVVVVMTKEASYRRIDSRMWIPSRIYKDFPQLREALATRGIRYNMQLDQMWRLQEQGIAHVVCPTDLHGVTRTTRDVEPLEKLYADGLRAGRDLALWLERNGYSKPLTHTPPQKWQT
ncbi:MAG: patatin family protein [Bacteroidales bacterium]|nr:patatin family protein [Bacteroidales bacterium]